MTPTHMNGSWFAIQRHRRLAGEHFAAAVLSSLQAHVTDRAEALYVAHCGLGQPIKALARVCRQRPRNLRRMLAGVEDRRDDPATDARIDGLTGWAQRELVAC